MPATGATTGLETLPWRKGMGMKWVLLLKATGEEKLKLSPGTPFTEASAVDVTEPLPLRTPGKPFIPN